MKKMKKLKILALLLMFSIIMPELLVNAEEVEPYVPWEENVLTADINGERCTFYLEGCTEQEDGTWQIAYISYLPQGGHYVLGIYIDFDKLDYDIDSFSYGGQSMAVDRVLFGEADSTGKLTDMYGAISDKDIGAYVFGMQYAEAGRSDRHVRGEFYAAPVSVETFNAEKQVKMLIENAVFDFTLNSHHEKAAAPNSDNADNYTTADAVGVNTFVGTVNGEPVIGYLDKTYVYVDHGKDYNAAFVTLDENGAPAYKIHISIDENVPVGTYSGSGGSDTLSAGVYTKLRETTLLWGDVYSLSESKNNWTIELFSAEYSDDGIFEGKIEATLPPSRYTKSPSYTAVTISGTFHFQMHTIHPTMESYREEHPDYNAKQSCSYIQSIGTPSSSFSGTGSLSSTDSQSQTSDHTCRTCKGSGSCTRCYGSGVAPNSNNNKLYDCPRCQGTGRCSVCNGTGSVY